MHRLLCTTTFFIINSFISFFHTPNNTETFHFYSPPFQGTSIHKPIEGEPAKRRVRPPYSLLRIIAFPQYFTQYFNQTVRLEYPHHHDASHQLHTAAPLFLSPGTVPTVCPLPTRLLQCLFSRRPTGRIGPCGQPSSTVGGLAPAPSGPRRRDGDDLSFPLVLIVYRCPIAQRTVRSECKCRYSKATFPFLGL